MALRDINLERRKSRLALDAARTLDLKQPTDDQKDIHVVSGCLGRHVKTYIAISSQE